MENNILTCKNSCTTTNSTGHFDIEEIKIFGFWIYLMSDCVLFCCLFSTYAVLMNGIADGPSNKDIFKLPFTLMETILLLFNSVTYNISVVTIRENNRLNKSILWMIISCILGISFIGMESYKFNYLIEKGFGPNRSAFLSSFFALTGIHSFHVISALIWMGVLIFQIIRNGSTKINKTRVECLSLFWNFLYVIWICIFSIVYLIGLI